MGAPAERGVPSERPAWRCAQALCGPEPEQATGKSLTTGFWHFPPRAQLGRSVLLITRLAVSDIRQR
jgi:hypothetical protein